MVETMDDATKAAFKEAFSAFDKDNDGVVNQNELGGILEGMGVKSTGAELKELLGLMDTNHDGKIHFYEFLAVMPAKMRAIQKQEISKEERLSRNAMSQPAKRSMKVDAPDAKKTPQNLELAEPGMLCAMASINKWLVENKIKSNISPDLEAFGAEDPEDLVDLEDDDIKYLCSKLKKLEARRFQKALLKLGGNVKEKDRDSGKLLSAFDQDAVRKARGANYWDMFFSHNQREGGQQTDLLATKHKVRGINPWLDQWNGHGTKPAVIDVTKDGMKEGVKSSAIFILILTKGIFTRPFCRLEIITAIKAQKPILTVMETDPRFNAFDFGTKTAGVPIGFHSVVNAIMSDICALPLRRDADEHTLLQDKIVSHYTRGLVKPLSSLTKTDIDAAENAVWAAPPPPVPHDSAVVSNTTSTPKPLPPSPVAALPGGYQPGETLYYIGSSHTVFSGDKVVHGQQGEVMGPAIADMHKMMFPGNTGNISCLLTELSRTPP